MIDIFILNNKWSNFTWITYCSNNTKLKVKLNKFNHYSISLPDEENICNNKNFFLKNLMANTQYK